MGRIKDALAYRATMQLPPINLMVASVVIGTITYLALAIVIRPTGTSREFNFIQESGAVTALSAIFLAMASAFSIGALTISIRASDRATWLWGVMALGFGFLAMDELLQFHERVGKVLDHTAGSGPFRGWNDVIVILYGLLALPIAGALLPTILRYRHVLELFTLAFFFYGVHTVIDSTQEPPTTLSVICEESAKLICGVFLMLGSFTGFLGDLWNMNIEKARGKSVIGGSLR
jgi:hypothetical protein